MQTLVLLNFLLAAICAGGLAFIAWKLYKANSSQHSSVDNKKDQTPISTVKEDTSALDQLSINADILSPLEVIAQHAKDLLSSNKISDRSATDQLNAILNEASHVSDKLMQWVEYKNVADGKVNLHIQPVSVFELVNDIFNEMSSRVDNDKMRLINGIDRNEKRVLADRKRLTQVIKTLVDNGLRYSESGYVKVSAIQSGDAMHLSVIDTGKGIPEKKWRTLFDKPSNNGHIGLYLSRLMVEAHGGSLWVSHNHSGGSIFSFSMPYENTQTQKSQATTSLTDSAAATEKLKEAQLLQKTAGAKSPHTKILVVDDDPVNRMVLQGMLKNQYTLAEACDGIEAVTMVKNEVPNLILMDVMMPRMSGYEACLEIRKTYDKETLPIVFITAKRAEDEKQEVARSGGTAMLTKPIVKDVLLHSVEQYLTEAQNNRFYSA